MTIDTAKQVRNEDRLDEQAISHFLSKNVPELYSGGHLNILQFSGGASNLTYEIEMNERSLILRTAPKGVNIKSAHDMQREFKVLSLLQGHFSLAPSPLAYCDNPEYIGRPFYLMEKIKGVIPRRKMPVKITSEQAKHLCQNLVETHNKLHSVDLESSHLIDLGKPTGYVQRQVEGWVERYKNARTDDAPSANRLMCWLEDHQPEDSYQTPEQASLIHNDFKFDNVVLNPHNLTEIIAVLDWEMATVGDPLMDLGCSMAYWIEKSDSDAMQMIRTLPTHLDGMLTREQIVDTYLQISGRNPASFDYYYVFGLFRLAVIVQQIYKRYKSGHTTNKKFASFGQICHVLIHQCNKYNQA
ncbi:MAG: phosphotransferase family protein [bacterium]